MCLYSHKWSLFSDGVHPRTSEGTEIEEHFLSWRKRNESLTVSWGCEVKPKTYYLRVVSFIFSFRQLYGFAEYRTVQIMRT